MSIRIGTYLIWASIADGERKDMGEKMAVCTVIGFPNGNMTTAVKEFETKDAIANGASEIDMVINIGFLKDGRYDEVEEEIRQIHEACDGKILKVIIETCLLTEEEKIKMCEIVTVLHRLFIMLRKEDFLQPEQHLKM